MLTFELAELFPKAYFKPSALAAISYAYDYAYHSKHNKLTLDFILYGVFCYIHNELKHSKAPRWYIEPQIYETSVLRYLKESLFCRRLTINNDIYTLSTFAKHIAVRDTKLIDYNELFYIICYMVKKEHVTNKPLVFFNPTYTVDSVISTYNTILGKSLVKQVYDNNYSSKISLAYTTDLTYLAACGKTAPMIGRKAELDRVAETLCKRDKNNAILIGEPGVGKKSIVNTLALNIVQKKVCKQLQGYHILSLNFPALIAEVIYPGTIDLRVSSLFKNIESYLNRNYKLIIFIEGIHIIDQLDLSDIFTKFINKTNVKIIGTSTSSLYKYIEESNTDLDMLFSTITIAETSTTETLSILENIQSTYEKFHNVKITTEALETIITLSNRYFSEYCFPTKAIDLLDETCAVVKTTVTSSYSQTMQVLPEHVFLTVSKKKAIPLSNLMQLNNFDDLEKKLNSRIISQKAVVQKLVETIKKIKMGLNDENRPLASFMFVGPTGVGKTQTAKILSELLFDNKMFRFDMSEFMEEHSVSKLIGTPHGYVGYDDDSQLTDKVRANPYCLLLFDEFEKAHPKIYNLFLQILEEGCLTDSKGRTVSFKNTIIILTSNVGNSNFSNSCVGFGTGNHVVSQKVMGEIKHTFSPEFLNRLDEIFMFNPLDYDGVKQIAKIYIHNLISKMSARKITLVIDDSVIEHVSRIGFLPKYGARELRRTIDRCVINPLADFLINNNISNGVMANVHVSLNNGKICFKQV